MPMRLYWGDIHAHCDISYGAGSLDGALAAARQHLDFCSITGHACWPDMPTDREKYGRVIKIHTEGFARLAEHWDGYLATLAAANEPGRFVAFPSQEWHSNAHGDHNVYFKQCNGAILQAETVGELRDRVEDMDAFVIPHHIGYRAGFRGINWETYEERFSPVVEIYSLHGCSEADDAPFPMLHTMGPRDHCSTARHGLDLGHRFGFIGSTDHHGGFPGSYGDGLLGIWADDLTVDAVWDALSCRRTIAATGDRIAIDMWLNDAGIGEETAGTGPREIDIDVIAADTVEFVEIIKNGRRLFRRTPRETQSSENGDVRAKLKVEYGWGPRDRRTEWDFTAAVTDGRLVAATPCFRGASVLSPSDAEFGADRLQHEVMGRDAVSISWRSTTQANPTVRHSGTGAMILEVEMPVAASIALRANGEMITHSLTELLEGNRVHYTDGWLTPAVLFHKAVPASAYRQTFSVVDANAERERDYYYVRVAQRNGQWAWASPIWVTA